MNIWEMTLQEYVTSMKGKKVDHWYYNRKGQLIHNHNMAVLDALQLGKQVPDRVISSLFTPLHILKQAYK